MGCFIACLGGTKKHKHLKSSRIQTLNPNSPNNSGLGRYQQLESVSAKLDAGEACSDLKTERPTTLRSVLGARKKVTFDLNVKTYELIRSTDYSECEVTEEVAPKNEQVCTKEIEKESKSEYPSNYRYKNFIDFEDDEEEDQDEDEFDDCLDDCFEEDDDQELYHSIDVTTMIGTSDDETFKNVHSVLCPVENTAQWREVKSKKTLPQSSIKSQSKENVSSDVRFHSSPQQEVRVDASLSVWIVGNGNQHNLIKAQTI